MTAVALVCIVQLQFNFIPIAEVTVSLALPEPSSDVLRDSPLRLVVCQIRFEETPSVADPKVALGIYEALGGRAGRYPAFEEFKGEQLDIRIGPSGPVGTQKTPVRGWRFSSVDRNWIVSILGNSASLETKTYTAWSDDFEPRLADLVSAVSTRLEPALPVRLGLRYVDVLSQPSGHSGTAGWEGVVHSSVLGPILHPVLGHSVIAAQQQVDFDAGDGVRCTLRHGTVLEPDRETPGYLLDWDVSDEQVGPFNAEAIRSRVNEFHRVALQLFQQAVTVQHLQALKEGA